MANRTYITDRAQIEFDALPSSEKDRVAKVIKNLEDFPLTPLLETYKIKALGNTFVAKAGRKYRIVFQHESQYKELIIIDIVNHDRLERFYGSHQGVEQ